MIDLAKMLILSWLKQEQRWPRDNWVHLFRDKDVQMLGWKIFGSLRVTIEYIPDVCRGDILTGVDYLLPQAQTITGESE